MKLAIISDIHEDIDTLKVAFRKIEKHKVDEIACLGDISGFSVPYYTYYQGRNAHKCLSLIRSNCKYIVAGNHDLHAGRIVPKDCAYFDFPDNWYELDFHDRHELAGDIIYFHETTDLSPLYRKSDIEFLQSVPQRVIVNWPGINIMLTHYVYPNLLGIKREFYSYGDEFKKHFNYMQSHDCQLSITGHSHVKGFYMVQNGKFKQYKYKKVAISQMPCCVGVPPTTSHQKRSGFCIFDNSDMTIQAVKL
ncbi:MAG: metallophosphoesterase [Bacteroidales bacterium]|nr:metallophosphoesterase [Bacteroidales bacterium]